MRKQTLLDSILFFAEQCNTLTSFNALLQAHTPIPTLVNLIINEMFVNEIFSMDFDNDNNYLFRSHYHIILEYSIELKKEGAFSFTNN